MIMDSYFHKLREDESGGQQRQRQQQQEPSAFDRISHATMTDITEFQDGGDSSSPFRRGNFDLLYSLCTQASAHRLLRELRQSTSSSSSSSSPENDDDVEANIHSSDDLSTATTYTRPPQHRYNTYRWCRWRRRSIRRLWRGEWWLRKRRQRKNIYNGWGRRLHVTMYTLLWQI